MGSVHDAIAKSAFPNGVDLECKECGKTQRVEPDECGDFLVNGWPKCCDQTMNAALPKPDGDEQ